MKKGTNDFHGSFFTTYESSGTDANPVSTFLRYDPTDSGNASVRLDPASQLYQPSKDHFRTVQPGFTIGGPIVKDRLVFFFGFTPLVNSRAKTVDFGSNNNNAGNQYFTQDRNTWYTTTRVDATLSQKIRVFGSWLYQYARETGDSLPISDPIPSQSSFLNTAILSPLTLYSHGLGWSAPNSTYNTGADISLTQSLVSTTRYGYFFENYHDFGWPTTSPNFFWFASGAGASGNDGNLLPDSLQNYNGAPANAGTTTTSYLQSYTLFNADKHYQFNQDFAIFKGGWWGTHNFKFGYQLNHLVNVISQNGNVPFAYLYPGTGQSYHPLTASGAANCKALAGVWGGSCAGQYGYLKVQDFATVLPTPAGDWNHALYVQDSWQVGKGVTLSLGLRIETESLPAPKGFNVKAINFPWSDKVAPRLGAAWDPTRSGKMKIFGSYGVVNDVMKLLLAQTSWGAQAFEWCSYPLGPNGSGGFNLSDIDLVFKGGRACPSGTAGANFGSGNVPASLTDAKSGVSLIENVNLRPWEPVAPGVKPYRQHEYVAGLDYEIKRGYDFEARYDRRRLDHVIEDSSLSDPDWGEIYTIVNPGEGVNSTVNGYASFLASLGEAFGFPGQAFNADPSNPFGTCGNCPAMPKAVRNYDGVEVRLLMTEPVRGLSGMISYTYSSLWGNYTGLTTTDQSDGGNTGRNSPDTTRAFDEPFYYYGANGKSTNGNLPTDRPNVFKGYAYYTIPWKTRQSTNIGLFQQFLQGSPVGSYMNLAAASPPLPFEGTYVFGRDKWVNLSRDASGNITIGNPTTRRTPWFNQTDMNVSHQIKVGERQALNFEATALNLINQRSVVAYFESMDSLYFATPLSPGGVGLYNGAATYSALMNPYDPQALINTDGVIQNGQYGQPFRFQTGRQLRLAVHYTF
jgi:hypothetical protein